MLQASEYPAEIGEVPYLSLINKIFLVAKTVRLVMLAKPRLILDEMCRLYGKFASHVRRVLFFLV